MSIFPTGRILKCGLRQSASADAASGREYGKGTCMVESRVLQIVRQFWENAIKLLLENPKNVRDLLALAGAGVVKRIDLRRVELVRTTFVERDYISWLWSIM
jgi:hypothetical protein